MTPKVVVLEDDALIASAFQKLFRNERIEAAVFERPDDVKEFLATNQVRTLIVDCLLPGISGIDFVSSLRRSYPPELLDVILMSGVFTEGSFIRDALRTTQALAFLKKPFSVDEVLPYLNGGKKGVSEDPMPRRTLYQIYGKNNVTARQRKKTIEALEELHGYDIPFLYALLVETEASGHLNIVNDKGMVYGISFANGAIVGADTPDEDTFIGRLLIDSGFITPEDLNRILPMREPKFLGERLIKHQLISPHHFDEVLAKQTSLRLARTISDETVRLNFVEADVEPTLQQITPDDFWSTLHDWSASKISSDWLAAHFTPWGQSKLRKNPASSKERALLAMPLIAHHEGLFEAITSGRSILELIESKEFPEGPLYKAIHFLLTTGVIVFQEEGESHDARERENFLRRTLGQLESKDVTQALGVLSAMTKTSTTRPDLVFQEFVRFLGEEPDQRDKELFAAYKAAITRAREITDQAKTPEFAQSRLQTNTGAAERKLAAVKLFEEARVSLLRSQFKDAVEKLTRVAEFDPKLTGLKILLAWSKLGGIENNPRKIDVIKGVESELLQVEPEEKLDALYSFVSGLLAKAKGDLPLAKKYFEKALNVDQQLMPARRELAMLQAAAKNKPDMFNADLKTLVGNLFKKR